MALDELLGASQSFLNYMRGMREGKANDVAQATEQLNRFATTFGNIQQMKTAKERMKFAEAENLRAERLFPTQMKHAELQNQQLESEINAQESARKRQEDLAKTIGEMARARGLNFPNLSPDDMAGLNSAAQAISDFDKKIQQKTSEAKGEALNEQTMQSRTNQQYIRQEKALDYKTKQAALENLKADTFLKNANSAAAAAKSMKDNGVLTSPEEIRDALTQMGFDPAVVDAMKYAIDADIMPQVGDLLSQLKALTQWKFELSNEKSKIIDPMTYFVFKDDPAMEEYLKEGLKGKSDPTQIMRDINDQIDAVKGQLLKYKFDLDASMKGYRTRGAQTLDNLNQQTGNLGTQAGATVTELPEDVSQTTVGQMTSQYGVDPYEALAIAKWESGGKFDNSIRGTSGEYGIMQIMPATGEGMGYSIEDLQDPATNFEAGLKYLSEFAGDTPEERIQQYNAGPGDKSPNYLNSIMGYINEYKQNPELFNSDLAKLESAIGGTPMPETTEAPTTTPAPATTTKTLGPPAPVQGPTIQQARQVMENEQKSLESAIPNEELVSKIVAARNDGFSYQEILNNYKENKDFLSKRYGQKLYDSMIKTLQSLAKGKK